MEDSEIKSFVKVWITIFSSLTYCYLVSKTIPKGFLKLFSVLPVISIFLYLPLYLSSPHLGGNTAFFIAWLANFKLLLLSFDRGPLYSNPSLSFINFISIACFPIKIKQKNPQTINTKSSLTYLNYAIKVILVALLLCVYDYKQYLHPNFILFLYCFHMYFMLEITLVIVAEMVQFLLGLELEPQFNEPYLSTSLQDFWGNRWNLMVTGILRSTIYEPIRPICTRIVGKRMGLAVAILVTFLVSGIMHELMFFYHSRTWPTWEVMWFFALHGLCLVAEIALKKSLSDKLQLHPLVSRPMVVGFVMATGLWLFWPQLLKSGVDERAIKEYVVLGEFAKALVKDTWVSVTGGGRGIDL
ncbi:hypothetical protein MKW94_018160 [Papaver nudicaule]|uniref:Wax synthase domain-containing protein n=1 Tax=Papaver nudicaule TaxID=74823 RepID=A0AA41UXB4_PAPNU|nr:hypothetical protein [Papaver nudicaule]